MKSRIDVFGVKTSDGRTILHCLNEDEGFDGPRNCQKDLEESGSDEEVIFYLKDVFDLEALRNIDEQTSAGIAALVALLHTEAMRDAFEIFLNNFFERIN